MWYLMSLSVFVDLGLFVCFRPLFLCFYYSRAIRASRLDIFLFWCNFAFYHNSIIVFNWTKTSSPISQRTRSISKWNKLEINRLFIVKACKQNLKQRTAHNNSKKYISKLLLLLLLTKKKHHKCLFTNGRAEVHLSEHTWLIWRALYLKAHKESDNGIGLWGLSPVRQPVTAVAAVVVIPTVPRWPVKRKNGSPLWVEIWSWAYSPSLSLFVWKAPRHLPAWLWR